MACNPAPKETVEALLRSPRDLRLLHKINGNEFQTDLGEKFPIIDGIAGLIHEKDREQDLGDKRFYEENPFGVRDWSNLDEVEAGVEKEIKDILAKVPKDALIADVGCGSGRVSNYMSLHGYTNVLSLDYSLNSLRMVEQNSNNYCVEGNNLNLPLASDSFDLVISTGVIHHTPDPKKAFAECCRILKPEGLFFVKMRNIHSPFYSKRPKRPLKELRSKYENLFIKDLITFFTTAEVEKMLAENNLEIQYGWKTSFTHRQHFYVAKKAETLELEQITPSRPGRHLALTTLLKTLQDHR